MEGTFYKSDNKSFVSLHERYCKSIQDSLVFSSLLYILLMIIPFPALVASSDYMDALEFDTIPIENSQYWVMPLIKDYVAKNKDVIAPNLIEILNSYSCMDWIDS